MPSAEYMKLHYDTLIKDTSAEGLYSLYFYVLEELISNKRRVTFLTDEDRKRLTANDKGQPPFKKELKGYPLSPIFATIANHLAILTVDGICPVEKQPFLPHLHEHSNPIYRSDRIRHAVKFLQPIPNMLRYWNSEQFSNRMDLILRTLRKQGMLDLLQMRKTIGSRFVFPFTREQIIASSEELHSPLSKLSVAGRAVAKHAVRDSTKAWWGECTGTEEQKNAQGAILLQRVLDNALWINIHGLPGELPALEVRTDGGYGLRCLTEPLSFRGFLEPYKPEGWLDKFSH